ncbi:hypothetical protein [Pseudomonas lactucae]|uniref:Uncharacterized protein n=1 Tax=Pseudomonas lactucae TaxID=2813360 RepID=A0A9X0YAN5_9PSED|nr:hypothetical protein [Pseudomonas lactucae]MBN2976465.1 hypothetical protein [Pseudomonas lactucae]MBN2988054.1 hypothetical protein [Pseudomonas lactucae]
MGIMHSYNPAPYTCELQGCTPGRLLKNSAKPANNKQCYFVDNHQKIIAEIQYAKHVKPKEQWIIYRRFFINTPDTVIELNFGSALEESVDANLDSVAVNTLESGHTTAHYSLLNTGEYSESFYKYDGKKIASITEKIWRDTFTTRDYEITHVNGTPTIYEVLPDNSKILIYPEE